MKKAIYLGYRSHQTSTCGLHVHVNRDCLGDNREEQDETISRILYFVEYHWNELLKFSRRSEYAMNRWAARYGFEKTGREILDKAKKGNNGRYAAVNLMNYATIEFRMFRGTLKYNTFIAVLELVNEIIDTAIHNTDDSLSKLSWQDFVSDITEPELIQYIRRETKLKMLKNNFTIYRQNRLLSKPQLRRLVYCLLLNWLRFTNLLVQSVKLSGFMGVVSSFMKSLSFLTVLVLPSAIVS